MSRTFRLGPPELRSDLLTRPRLMRRLVGRWDHRVTVVVGGPGLGKTTALAQALAENRLAPRGEDIWIGLEAADADASSLAEVVATAVTTSPATAGRGPGGATPPVGGPCSPVAVAELVRGRAPVEVCLVLDDVHHLDQSGAAWLAELVHALPANGRAVLASRLEPPAWGRDAEPVLPVLRIDEDDLRFTGDELAQFAGQRGLAPGALRDTGGWPALAALAADGDARLIDTYLRQEVLDRLGSRRRHILGVVADLGAADDGLASVAVGAPVRLDRALAGVPLVARSADGWHVPHRLWRDAAPLTASDARHSETRRRAIRYLTDRGRFDEAFTLVEEAELWDLASPVLRAAALASDRLTSGQLERWLAASPQRVRESLGGRLARGLHAAFMAPATATGPMQEAAEHCRMAGDLDGEMAAIAQLCRLAWFWQEHTLLAHLVARIAELESTGHPTARALGAVVQASLADLAGDDDALLARLDSIEPSALDQAWRALVGFWSARVRLRLGETDPVHEIVARLGPADDPALRGVAAAMELWALWADGHVDLVLERLPGMVAAVRAAGVQYNLHLALTGACLACARTGDVAAARRYYDESLLVAPPSPTGRDSARIMVARAYLELAEGREARAAATLREAIAVHGLDRGVDRDVWRQHIPITYVLVPETRDHWDGATLRGHLHTARRLAQALVAVRQGRGRDHLAQAELPAPDIVRSAFDVRWAAELAVGLDHAGRGREGRDLLDALGPPGRLALQGLAGPGRGGPAPAKALLAVAPPPQPSYLAVLGPLTLRRGRAGGDPVVAPDLRRTKVRALVAFLVVHRQATRDALAEALWPGLPERAAANNLGVTLSHLRHVLEPWRGPGEPAFLLRLDGPAVRLVTGRHLVVDVDDFDRHLAEAARADVDQQAAPALEHYLAAVDLYRDDLYADLPEAGWFALERHHYRTRFVSGATRAAQLLVGRGEVEPAESVARRALAVDRWAEDAYGVMVRAALARHDRSAARRMLRCCRAALSDLGAQPSQATRQLERMVG